MVLRRVIMMVMAGVAIGAVASLGYRLVISTPLAVHAPTPLPMSALRGPFEETPSQAPDAQASDTQPSEAPAQNAQAETQSDANPLIIIPTFDVVRVDKGEGVIAGRATPHAPVVIMDHDADMARGQTDSSGHFYLSLPFAAGEHVLTLREEVKDLTITSQETVTLLIEPDRLPLTTLDAPQQPTRLLTPPRDDDHAPIRIDMVEMNEKGELSISGHIASQSPSESMIALYIDNQQLAEIRVEQDHSWTMRSNHIPAAGTHHIRADVLTDTHELIARAQVPFTAPEPFASPAILVRRGDSLWRISRTHLGRGMRYTEIYDLNQDQIKDPNLIFPGQKLNMPADQSAPARLLNSPH
jgi:nucleoid-associated protein YgaU